MEVSVSKEREPASGAPQGARRATGGAPEERRDGRGRWSAKRKAAAILRLLRGEDLETLSRELGVTAATLSGWRDQFLDGGEANLRAREADVENEETQRLKSLVADLSMSNELLREKSTAWRPHALWPGGGRSHEPRRFALRGKTLRRGARNAGMGDGAFELLLSAPHRRATPASAAAARTEDGVQRRDIDRKDPRGPGGLAVLWRGPSQSVGAAALSGGAHVEGTRAAADARSAGARAGAHAEGRE